MNKIYYPAFAMITACSGSGNNDVPGAKFEIAAAPLSLTGVGDACYTIEVQNDVGDTVWVEQHLCASQYGDSVGAITYVGPCDAQSNDSDNVALNTVTLTLENLYSSDVNHADYAAGAIADSEWENPCGKRADGSAISPNGDGYGPCQLVYECEENADVSVEFNITVMRDADQGMFDIAVNFDDIFCSAKLDCLPEFLHDAEGVRGPTVNLAFACSAGEGPSGPQTTNLYLSNVTLTCVDANPNDGEALDPIVQHVNLSASTPGQHGAAPPLLYQRAEYSGSEDFEDIEKCYWNHSFGLDLEAIGARACTMSATGTASQHALPGGAIEPDAFWPLITWNVDVVNADGSLCGPNPLDLEPTGVETGYVMPSTTPRPSAFTARYQCAAPPSAPPVYACVGANGATFEGGYADAGAPAVLVTVGGITSTPYPLPAGAKLVEHCCLAECCTP